MRPRSLLDQLFVPTMGLGACFVVPVWTLHSPFGLVLSGVLLAAPILWLTASLLRSLRG